jgi:hypothetical protein
MKCAHCGATLTKDTGIRRRPDDEFVCDDCPAMVAEATTVEVCQELGFDVPEAAVELGMFGAGKVGEFLWRSGVKDPVHAVVALSAALGAISSSVQMAVYLEASALGKDLGSAVARIVERKMMAQSAEETDG